MKTDLRRGVVAFVICCLLACALAARQTRAQEKEEGRQEPTSAPVVASDEAPPPPPEKEEEGKSTVFGRAVYADTGRPVRRARVLLLNSDGKHSERGSLTNSRGEFRVAKVPAGKYFVAVDATGILSPVSFVDIEGLKEGTPRFDEIRAHFEEIEVDGKGDREVTVRATRGAAIGGRAAYADGEPATGVSVHIMRLKEGRTIPLVTGINPSSFVIRTDDRGVYRVSGLPAGEYVVGVSEVVEHGDASSGDGGLLGPLGSPFSMTFYPSAWRASKATSLRLAAGEEREGVDVTIAERETRTVSGIVRGRRDQQPVARAILSLQSKESGILPAAFLYAGEGQMSVTTDEAGRWQFNELPDGVYTINVQPGYSYEETTTVSEDGAEDGAAHARARVPPKKKYASKQQEIRVAGGDLTGVVFELSEGGSISGTIKFEGGEKRPGDLTIQFQVVATGASEVASEVASGFAVGDLFIVDGVAPGKVYLRFNQFGPDAGKKFYIKEIRWRGRDLRREPLEVGDGARIEGVQVLFSSEAAALRVRVLGGGGKGAAVGAGVGVHLVPSEAALGATPETQLACVTGADGACALSGAPGEYLLIVTARDAAGGPLGPEEINRRAPSARRVMLRAGENRPVEVAAPEGN
ncbi:MAG: carboxypeptidase-like regulatory domain-containing protein [Acidobacteria bacterium]|nr:carboxypeptidase-like regulatory domain-containing protein [Acidobacteriota bacterium]